MAKKHLILCGDTTGSISNAKVHDLKIGKDMIHLDTEAIVKKMIQIIDPVMHDFLEIATYVYVGDQLISRGGEQSFGYGNKWHREIFYKIPVSEYEIWDDASIRELLEESLSFAAGETYHFEFVKQTGRKRPQLFDFQGKIVDKVNFEKVVLFSGGLDSFAGVLEEIVGNNNICMVSHQSNNKTLKLQKDLHAYISDIQKIKHRPIPLHIPVMVNKEKSLTHEKSQRTRSFLFAALGAIIANYEKLSEVIFYENGVVSCNLSWDCQTLQARATRTTHPKLLRLLSMLVSELLQKDFSFVNPYFNLTKKEVVDRLIKYRHESSIIGTRSCAEAIYRKPQTHCGTCSQCLDRRFATLAANCLKYDPWHIYRKNIFTDSLDTTCDRSMALGFTGFAGLMENITKDGFTQRYSCEILEIISNIDVDRQKAAETVFDLHKRFAGQVNYVLDEMITNHNSDLRKGNLPNTCLLRMVIEKQHNNIFRANNSKIIKKKKKTEKRNEAVIKLWDKVEHACFIHDQGNIKFYYKEQIKLIPLRPGTQAPILLAAFLEGTQAGKDIKNITGSKLPPSQVVKNINRTLNSQLRKIGFGNISGYSFIYFDDNSNSYTIGPKIVRYEDFEKAHFFAD